MCLIKIKLMTLNLPGNSSYDLTGTLRGTVPLSAAHSSHLTSAEHPQPLTLRREVVWVWASACMTRSSDTGWDFTMCPVVPPTLCIIQRIKRKIWRLPPKLRCNISIIFMLHLTNAMNLSSESLINTFLVLLEKLEVGG